jgi:hypothetical protein
MEYLFFDDPLVNSRVGISWASVNSTPRLPVMRSETMVMASRTFGDEIVLDDDNANGFPHALVIVARLDLSGWNYHKYMSAGTGEMPIQGFSSKKGAAGRRPGAARRTLQFLPEIA